MSEEILINVTPPETRVAVIENGVVQEIIIERTAKRGLVGNIYKGKVCRVLPGMQAAFVDAGLERAAFLHASDIHSGNGDRSEQITDLVREGGEGIVQVVKDDTGETFALKEVERRGPADDRYFEQVENEFRISSQVQHEVLRKSYEIHRVRKMLRVRYLLIDMKIAIEAGRALLYDTSRVVDLAVGYNRRVEENPPEDKAELKELKNLGEFIAYVEKKVSA